MIGRRGMAAWLCAAFALGYLAVMVANGARPVQRQLVRSEPNGVLALEPERVRRVEVTGEVRRLALVRSGEAGWTASDGAAADAAVARHVDTAIRMMQRSAPVRTLSAEELRGIDPAPFGLAAPRVVVALYEDETRPLLVARFGERNPDGFLQYMRIDGDARLLLMSRFVGEEWASALDAAGQR